MDEDKKKGHALQGQLGSLLGAKKKMLMTLCDNNPFHSEHLLTEDAARQEKEAERHHQEIAATLVEEESHHVRMMEVLNEKNIEHLIAQGFSALHVNGGTSTRKSQILSTKTSVSAISTSERIDHTLDVGVLQTARIYDTERATINIIPKTRANSQQLYSEC